ncbi:MAG: hypothetical protein ACTTKK_10380 [Ottowia sp.]
MLAKLPSEQALWLVFQPDGIKNKSKFKASKHGLAHVSLRPHAIYKGARKYHARLLASQGANPAKGALRIHAAPQKKRGCESRNPLI